MITNTQWDAGVIELTPIHTANRLNRPVNLPDRNLNSEAFRYQSQLQILSDPIIQQFFLLFFLPFFLIIDLCGIWIPFAEKI